jgi:hypothetical protein
MSEKWVRAVGTVRGDLPRSVPVALGEMCPKVIR